MDDQLDRIPKIRTDGAGSKPHAGEERRNSGSGSGELDPNELAELYDLFFQFQKLVKAEADGRDPQVGNSTEDWADILGEFLNHGHPDGAPGWGEQQSERNDVYISDYRDIFGDGDRVDDFHYVSTVEPPSESYEPGPANGVESIPVAPDSGEHLPVVVADEDELAEAVSLLEEFPAYPEADHPPGESALSQAESLGELPAGRIESIKITVLSIDREPGSKRDAAYEVETEFGDVVGLDFWSTHAVDVRLKVGESYELEEVTLKTWEDDGGRGHRLSSTRDLSVREPDGSLLTTSETNQTEPPTTTTTGNRGESEGEGGGSDRVESLMEDFDWDDGT